MALCCKEHNGSLEEKTIEDIQQNHFAVCASCFDAKSAFTRCDGNQFTQLYILERCLERNCHSSWPKVGNCGSKTLMVCFRIAKINTLLASLFLIAFSSEKETCTTRNCKMNFKMKLKDDTDSYKHKRRFHQVEQWHFQLGANHCTVSQLAEELRTRMLHRCTFQTSCCLCPDQKLWPEMILRVWIKTIAQILAKQNTHTWNTRNIKVCKVPPGWKLRLLRIYHRGI